MSVACITAEPESCRLALLVLFYLLATYLGCAAVYEVYRRVKHKVKP